MGVSHTLRLDLMLSGDVEVSGYQPNGILEGREELEILYEFSTWDVTDQFFFCKMSTSLILAKFTSPRMYLVLKVPPPQGCARVAPRG